MKAITTFSGTSPFRYSAKRNWFIIIFVGAWLGAWVIGELVALGAVTGLFGGNPGGLFIMFWLIAWTVGGFFAFKTFLWNLKRKEIINCAVRQRKRHQLCNKRKSSCS